jgi:hypothetical protein
MAELDDPKRLSHFRGTLIAEVPDPVLEACVAEAALVAQAPSAILTFVMGRVQYFRASIGLAPELTMSRATSRCDSFCQFIVREEKPFIVRDAVTDPRVPKTLVEVFHIGAYLGVPVYLDGDVLGSLCVIDGKPRDWTPEILDGLTALGERVSQRLLEIARTDPLIAPSVPPVTVAGATALANDLALDAHAFERSLLEVSPFIRLAQGLLSAELPLDAFARGTSVLREAADLFDDMLHVSQDLSSKSELLCRFLTTYPPKAGS